MQEILIYWGGEFNERIEEQILSKPTIPNEQISGRYTRILGKDLINNNKLKEYETLINNYNKLQL